MVRVIAHHSVHERDTASSAADGDTLANLSEQP
jgi:hypothetical protein